jgi:hypothetical protein
MTKEQISHATAAANELASSMLKGDAVEESQTIEDAFVSRP